MPITTRRACDFQAVNKNLADTWRRISQLEIELEDLRRNIKPQAKISDTGELRRHGYQLHQRIDKYFNIDELHELIASFGLDPENFKPFEAKAEQSREFVFYMLRHVRLNELKKELTALRPLVDWNIGD